MNITPKTIALAMAAIVVFALVWIAADRQKNPTRADTQSAQMTSTAPSDLPPAYETKENTEGNVTVTVTPQLLQSDQRASFEVVFDTHSVNLDFDVAAIAELRDSRGNTYGQPVWKGDLPGGHHREGTLSFPTPLSGAIQTIILTLTNIAGVKERTFVWNF